MGREGQTFEGRVALIRYANLVKLPHTLFALPFAMVGVVLASYVEDVTAVMILWVAIAFTSARSRRWRSTASSTVASTR